nr:hypothetical protein [Tanacetum cinerariifolium]
MSTKERKLEIIERVLHLSLEEELDVVEYALETLAAHSAPDDYTPIMPERSAEELRARFNQAMRESDEAKGIPHERVKA